MISQQFSAYFIVQCNSRLILIFNAIFVDICNDMQFETIFLHPSHVLNAWFIELSRLSIRFYFILRISLRLKDFHVISFIDIILKTFINRYLSNQMVKRERITENTQQHFKIHMKSKLQNVKKKLLRRIWLQNFLFNYIVVCDTPMPRRFSLRKKEKHLQNGICLQLLIDRQQHSILFDKLPQLHSLQWMSENQNVLSVITKSHNEI